MDKEEPLRYMPDYYDGVYEMIELLKSHGVALSKFDNDRERVLLNQFIVQADETGIAIFEDQAGIIPSPDEGLEERRKNVLLKLLPPKPLTIRYLNHLLEFMDLKANVKVDYPKRLAVVSANNVDIGPNDINSIKYLLNIALPANMGYQVGISLSDVNIQREVYIGIATIADTFLQIKPNLGQLNFKHNLINEIYIGIGNNIFTSTSVGFDDDQKI